MATFIKPVLDFDVIREIWNRYELSDNSILKVKLVLVGVKKRGAKQAAGQPSEAAKSDFDLNIQQVTAVLSNETGAPDTRNYSPQELQAAIIKDDIRFTTITQDWNEYVVDDGTRIKIQPIIMRVAKTSKFNDRGEPVYWTEVNLTVQVKTPTSSMAPTS